MPSETLPDIMLVSTADWDNPYWTNKQHMAVQFVKRGHRVFYIESQGLRQPTVNVKDLRRIWKRLKRGFQPPRRVHENLYVWSPLVVPWQRYRLVRKLNRVLLRGMSTLWCWCFGVKPRILWTYSPLTTELYNLSGYDLVVYHAVDDIKSQPGMPRESIERAEVALTRAADLVFTTAPNLQAFHVAVNERTYYFPNVADFEHFNLAMCEETVLPADMAVIPGPVIGFIGAISSYKLDFPLIHEIAKANPDLSFVFVGEVGEGDPRTNVDNITSRPNVYLLGGRDYLTLPSYLKAFDVAILPNHINDYTRSMFPMKFFEYLAAGKPVVATQLPALAEYGDVAALVSTPAAFAEAIREALDGKAAPLELRLAAARDQTYDARTARMWSVVEDALVRRAARSNPLRSHSQARNLGAPSE